MAVLVNAKWCKKCRICIEMCPKKVMGTTEAGIACLVDEEGCSHCALCEWICPDFAIKVTKE